MYCAVDISTDKVGFSIVNNLEEMVYMTYNFLSSQSHAERREKIVSIIKNLGAQAIFCEEVRLYNSKFRSPKFINMDVIKRLLMILTSVIDAGIDVYTMNVISWKTRILKHSGFEISKEGSQAFVKDKYGIDVNHDTSDAICQALYAKRFNHMCTKFD